MIKVGDMNTKYFHIRATNMKRNNRIRALQLEDGSWTSDHRKISSSLTKHFLNIFSEERSTPIDPSFTISTNPISDDENEAHGAVPSPEEIEQTLKQSLLRR
ncbi:uncharacterized protein M6B38_110595 [Iris pallida]|uniref:Uncharacterized protein n=1 Tax=Iris pallida TaxID=29817 RepID=A0AAX6DZS8_IRIPA|nr:uncharacterized protein M6B38_110595 [Iris pallida]